VALTCERNMSAMLPQPMNSVMIMKGLRLVTAPKNCTQCGWCTFWSTFISVLRSGRGRRVGVQVCVCVVMCVRVRACVRACVCVCVC
jgi:hypothetical protein